MIAAAAETIVASPSTVTGSIGVLAAKVDGSRMLRQQRVRVASLSEGAPPISAARPLTRSQRRQLSQRASALYAEFAAKVAADRGLPLDTVLAHAQGRVWTGSQAHRRGLVDALGGFEDALAVACASSGLEEEHAAGEVDLIELSRPKSLLASLASPASATARAALAGRARELMLALGLADLVAAGCDDAAPCGAADGAADDERDPSGVRLLAELPPEFRLRDH